MTDPLWPQYDGPEDLSAIEAVPLADRGLPATTYDVLCRAADLWPERTALSVMPEASRWREHSAVTFGELLTQVNRAANALHALGIRRGDAVGLQATNRAELIVATLAAQVAGIAAPVNPGLRADHVTELLARSGARLVDLDQLAELAAAQPGDRFVGTPPEASDIAAVFHTGGTTGVPKLAAHTHSNEVADAWMIAAGGLLDEDSVVFAALPLFHVNAVVVTVLAPLLRGQHVVWAGQSGYRDVALYGEFWQIVEHFRISAMSAVPTVYQVLAGCPVDADISSMRFAMVGASAVTAPGDAAPPVALLRVVEEYLRRYHRHEVHVDAQLPATPALIVANHGFGGIVDLNVLALATVFDRMEDRRHVTFLVHQIAWTLRLGRFAEALGCVPGCAAAVERAFAAEDHVAVFPGGDIDAAKPTKDRNVVTFAGRSGFARVAMEYGVPVVPVVTAGAGESLLVLSDGQALARALRLPRLLRVKALPVSLTFPWGLNIGIAGMLPYAPLPTKLVTAVLPPMTPETGESAPDFAARVEAAMQTRMTQLTSDRRPVIG